MEKNRDYSYISGLYRKLLENDDTSLELIDRRMYKIESRIRNRLEAILMQLSILQREEKELETIIEEKKY